MGAGAARPPRYQNLDLYACLRSFDPGEPQLRLSNYCTVLLLLIQVSRDENATTGSALATELRAGGYTGVIAICTANVSRSDIVEYKARRQEQ